MMQTEATYYGFVEKCQRVQSENNQYDNFQITFDAISKTAYNRIFGNGNKNKPLTANLFGDFYTPTLIYINIPKDYAKKIFRSEKMNYIESSWWNITRVSGENSIDAQFYQSTDDFTQPENYSIRIDEVEYNEKRNLKKNFSLKEFKKDQSFLIRRILEEYDNILSLFPIKNVSVYDVGQGNANAICMGLLPIIYYDLGGGYGQNHHTYSKKKFFCKISQPLVLLSHWDIDHYYTAFKNSEYYDLPWIAPCQNVGAFAYSQALELDKRNNLFLWNKDPNFKGKNFQLLKCRGRDRNNSGLALIAILSKQRFILMPGDCNYKNIPLEKSSFQGLVATHHGGNIANKEFIPRAALNGFIAYSYGKHNTFKHPSVKMLDEYSHRGWKSSKYIIVRKFCSCIGPFPKCYFACDNKDAIILQ